ncbi:UNVERIFIED_CONTAM: hypothetical protein RMT77_009219 [Armadillidium vulgare]
MLFLFVLIKVCKCQRKILEDDNIAVEQYDVPIFAVPAPGIRFGGALFQDGANRGQQNFANQGNGINDVIGNLLPEVASASMPSIVSLDVGCYPQRMAVEIIFDKPFNGIIYSKGFYGIPECTYVTPNSRQREISFEVGGQGCGLQYIETPGQPGYLENVIIIQNEPGIQEIWDTARGLRCLSSGGFGEGRNRQTVSAALNVAMLEQQVVTFSSDATASASMDIQVGRGPFAPSASGLVKIGELMTMVVTVEGPSDIDLHVRQCIAHDGTNDNTIDLTDQNGCVLKRKIIGSWQKKRNTQKKKSPVFAFAHFQAFKFPDQMDVYIECEVDLCAGRCPVCQEDQGGYGSRKRRSLPRKFHSEDEIPSFETSVDESELKDKLGNKHVNDITDDVIGQRNKSENAALRLARRLRVLSPDDITVNGDEFSSITLIRRTSEDETDEDICMSLVSFVTGIIIVIVILITSSILTAVLCIRVRTIPSSTSSFPPDSSFHAFSTVSGKTT